MVMTSSVFAMAVPASDLAPADRPQAPIAPQLSVMRLRRSAASDRPARAPPARTARSCTGRRSRAQRSARICGTFSQPVGVVDQHAMRIEHVVDGDVGIDDAGDVDDAGSLAGRPRSRRRGGGGRCRAPAGRRRRRPAASIACDGLPLGAHRRDREAERLDEADEAALAQDRAPSPSSAATRSAWATGVPSLSGHMTSALAPAASA